MRLRDDSLIIRVAYFGDGRRSIPRATSLCVLFWRCAVLAPLKCVFFAVVFPLFAMSLAYDDWKDKRRIARIERDDPSRSRFDSRAWWEASLLREVAFAIKHRVCPRVYIEQRDVASGLASEHRLDNQVNTESKP